MIGTALAWTGIVLALGLLLVMALGPLIVEADAKLHEGGHHRRRRTRPLVIDHSGRTDSRHPARVNTLVVGSRAA